MCPEYTVAEVCECPGQDFFSKWGQEGTIDFAKTFSELIILTASRTLMGTHTAPILLLSMVMIAFIAQVCFALHPMPCSSVSNKAVSEGVWTRMTWTCPETAFSRTG